MSTTIDGVVDARVSTTRTGVAVLYSIEHNIFMRRSATILLLTSFVVVLRARGSRELTLGLERECANVKD